MGLSTMTVLDSSAASKTLSQALDPNNSNAREVRVAIDDVMSKLTPTFSVCASLFTLPAAPQDVIQVVGSATKTVRIKKVRLSGQATTLKQWPVKFIRRVSALTGGTQVAPPVNAMDYSDIGNATAVVTHFTTLDTAVAANPASSVLLATELDLTAPAALSACRTFEFSSQGEKPIVLRGAADCLVINLGGGALTAGEKLSYSITWEEDAS
jgi:hypothetical protein